MSFEEALDETKKKKPAKAPTKKEELYDQDDNQMEKELPKKQKKTSTETTKESPKKQNEEPRLSQDIRNSITSTKPLDLSSISTLSPQDRKVAFDMIFGSLDENP